MASCEPMESPSGRAWDVSRKRCRERIASQISADGSSLASLLLVAVSTHRLRVRQVAAPRLRPFRLNVLQDAFDPLVPFHDSRRRRTAARGTPQPQPLGQLAAQERRGPFERRLVFRRACSSPIVV